jgi:hypothetical protein
MRPLSDLPLFGLREDSPVPSVRHPQPDIAYPDVPGFKVQGASQEAAKAMVGAAKTLRARAILCIARAPGGLTADEVAAELGASPFAVRPRITELNRLGLIEHCKHKWLDCRDDPRLCQGQHNQPGGRYRRAIDLVWSQRRYLE